MKITRENYEAYFLDYHEENLTQSQVAELMDFLAQNPELKKDFEAFEIITLEAEPSFTMAGKESLKKTGTTLSGTTSDEQIIAYFEGDLDQEESATLLADVAQSPALQKDFALYAKARVEPDTEILFPGKSSLKRYPLAGFMPAIQRFAVAAALIAFIATVYFMMPRIPDSQDIYVAQTQESETVTTETPVITPLEPATVKASAPVLAEQTTQRVSATPQETQHATPEESAPVLWSSDAANLASLNPIASKGIQQSVKPGQIEERVEFAWVSFSNQPFASADELWEKEQTPATPPPATEYTSFAAIAYTSFERGTGLNIENIQQELSRDRLSFWDIAGAGLAGISRITGTSLTVEKERDEDGKITLLAIGDRLRLVR